MKQVEKKLSSFVPQQFPEVYRTDAPRLVDFMTAYYDYVDSAPPDKNARMLPEEGDIDSVSERNLIHYVEKYLNGFPVNDVKDLRFLVKNVQDVYRSKGSSAGLSLLFRILYGQDVRYYVPGTDLLKPSDGTWRNIEYVEVTDTPFFKEFNQKPIYGVKSGATAIAESVVKRSVGGRLVNVMFLSNIVGEFLLDEELVYVGSPELPSNKRPFIIGSLSHLVVDEGVSDRRIGEKFKVIGTSGNGGEARVSELALVAASNVKYRLDFGGFGYTLDSSIEVLTLPLLTQDGDTLSTENGETIDFGNGSGAIIRVTSINNSRSLEVSTSIILPYENDTLSDTTFTVKQSLMSEDYASLITENGESLLDEEDGTGVMNDDTFIWEWEDESNITVGTIGTISVESPGSGYDLPPFVSVTDNRTSGLNLPDGLGGTLGTDAVIRATLSVGKNYTTGMKITNSGIGYRSDEEVRLSFGEDNFITTESSSPLATEDGSVIFFSDTDEITAFGRVVLGAVGVGRGYWADTSGWLNSDKVLQDSFYYQEYSYDIVSEIPFGLYERNVRDNFHPAGNELFGTSLVQNGSKETIANYRHDAFIYHDLHPLYNVRVAPAPFGLLRSIFTTDELLTLGDTQEVNVILVSTPNSDTRKVAVYDQRPAVGVIPAINVYITEIPVNSTSFMDTEPGVNTTIYLDERRLTGIEPIEVGDYVLMARLATNYALEEWGIVDSIDEFGDPVIGRGLFDTVPSDITSYTAAWFIKPSKIRRYVGLPAVDSSTQPMQLMFAPITSVVEGPAEDTSTQYLGERLRYPIRPANVKIDGVGFGEVDALSKNNVEVTFVPRSRVLETYSNPVRWDTIEVSSEPGQETYIDVIGIDDLYSQVSVDSFTVLGGGTNYTLDLTPYRPNYHTLRVKVGSYNSETGYRSLQSHVIEVRIGPFP